MVVGEFSVPDTPPPSTPETEAEHGPNGMPQPHCQYRLRPDSRSLQEDDHQTNKKSETFSREVSFYPQGPRFFLRVEGTDIRQQAEPRCEPVPGTMTWTSQAGVPDKQSCVVSVPNVTDNGSIASPPTPYSVKGEFAVGDLGKESGQMYWGGGVPMKGFQGWRAGDAKHCVAYGPASANKVKSDDQEDDSPD